MYHKNDLMFVPNPCIIKKIYRFNSNTSSTACCRPMEYSENITYRATATILTLQMYVLFIFIFMSQPNQTTFWCQYKADMP